MPPIPRKVPSHSHVSKPTSMPPSPYWTTTDGETVRLYWGHVLHRLRELESGSVHCVITSPPYWGLRDYGEADQLGLEPSPDCGTLGKAQCGGCFVCAMVAVFREVHRVLRKDGTLWLNLGDSYSGGSGVTATTSAKQMSNEGTMIPPRGQYRGLPTGNLVGIPWRVALALQADGWILRQDIIWHKPSPMPESVKNRCTKAHEYVFLFAKAPGYYYDAEAIKDESKGNDSHRIFGKSGNLDRQDQGRVHKGDAPTSNKRSVWKVSSFAYPGAHFATFPPKLVEPCLLAGTSAKGCCAKCGSPWKRVVEETPIERDRPNDYVKRSGEEGTGNSCANSVAGVETRTLGWQATCQCAVLGSGGVVPCTVLDPFVGSGTTVEVAVLNGRRGVGIDLSKKYLDENAIPRITKAMSSKPSLHDLIPEEPVKRVEVKKIVFTPTP